MSDSELIDWLLAEVKRLREAARFYESAHNYEVEENHLSLANKLEAAAKGLQAKQKPPRRRCRHEWVKLPGRIPYDEWCKHCGALQAPDGRRKHPRPRKGR